MNVLINVDVDDLEKAVAFFQRAFELHVGRRFDGVVEMLGSATPIYLLEKPTRDYTRHWTPVHLDFVVDDIEVAVTRAVTAGALLEQPIATHRWGRLALMADPFGHGFCFVQFLGRGYDELLGM